MLISSFLINLTSSLAILSSLNISQIEKALLLVSSMQLVGEYFNLYSVILWLAVSFISLLIFPKLQENIVFNVILYLFIIFISLFLIFNFNVIVSNPNLLLIGLLLSGLLCFCPSSIILFIKNKFFLKEMENQVIKTKSIEYFCPICNTKFHSNPRYCSNCNSLMQI